ncbi:hypothetical protein ACQP2U_43655 (plasmid) [Nocardia sp. CA-084685]|uniref:hypothetical protein n=1 Tax=Nocardia sp. CA-084685 TaxID=3239970 RepID=UPI003D95B3F0
MDTNTPHKDAAHHATTITSFTALITALIVITNGEHLPIVQTTIALPALWITCYVVDRWLF